MSVSIGLCEDVCLTSMCMYVCVPTSCETFKRNGHETEHFKSLCPQNRLPYAPNTALSAPYINSSLHTP